MKLTSFIIVATSLTIFASVMFLSGCSKHECYQELPDPGNINEARMRLRETMNNYDKE